MSKVFVLLLSLIIISGLSFGQGNYTLSGKVVDEKNLPVAGAGIVLTPVHKGAITDNLGSFAITGLTKGTYTIEISFIGYKSVIDTLRILGDRTFHAQLRIQALSLQEVEVSGNYSETRKKEEPLHIEIVNHTYLKQNLGGSLMNSLERLPGISTMDIGSGQAKPVIRGLGFNRVVIVENGIKHEAQQWGADHGLEIDQYAAEMIEIIKGPASLMYGSDAIGGVIDISSGSIPENNTIAGTVDLTGKTNNEFMGASVSLSGRKNGFFAGVRATLLGYGDYRVPADSVDIYSYRAPLHKKHLRNTAGKEQNLHFFFGIIKTRFQSRFHISNVHIKSGFFANAHGLEPRNVDTELHDKSNRDINLPYQQVNHLKIINSSKYVWDRLKLETDVSLQWNYRQEWSPYVDHGYMPAVFPDTMGFDPELERQFEKYVYSGNLKISYDVGDKTQFRFGTNGEYHDNRVEGRAFLIPAYRQLNLGAYVLGKHSVTPTSIIQYGLRYDFGNIHTRESFDWFPSPVIINSDTISQHLQRAGDLNLNFSNVSVSLGYNLNLEQWSFKSNIGRSFRMPIAKELAANGVNYHHFSYEIGNADLSPEISYQLDAGMEFTSRKFAAELTPFVNYFQNYIYLNPTSEYDRLHGNGNQMYYYTQSQVLRYGVEIHAHYQLWKFLQLGVIGEYVYSEQLSGEKKGYTLPFSPPASGILNLKYMQPKIRFAEKVYASVDFIFTAPQNQIVPPEETTEGYFLINVGLGGSLKIKNQAVNISFRVQNLLNNKYFNHTSYYRLINVPEPGRNFILNLSIPVTGKIKQK